MRLFLSRNAALLGDGLDLFFAPDFQKAHLDIVGESLANIPEVTDLIFAHAFYFLNGPRHFLVRRHEGQMQMADTSVCSFPKYQPRADRSKLSQAQQFKEDLAILTTFALQIYPMDRFSGSMHDHFTRQWTQDCASTGDETVSLAQAFGAQVFLDIQHVLRQDSRRGLEDLCEASERLGQSIEACREKTPQDAYDDDPDFKITQNNLRVAQATLQSAVQHRRAYQTHRDKHGDSPFFIYFLEMHPLLCGIVLFQTMQSTRSIGIRYAATHSKSIRLAGQYYYGCQMQRDYWKTASDLYPVQVSFQKSINAAWASPLVWKDMDYMFDVFGRESFFEGHLPKSNRDVAEYRGLWDNVAESMGHKRVMPPKKQSGHRGPILARPTLEEKPVKYIQDIDSYEPVAVTHRLYHSKYIKHKTSVEEGRVDSWTSETLKALLQAHSQQCKTSGGAKGRLSKPTESDGNISPVALLQTLKEALQRESRALRFDYIGFHAVCFDMLRTIQNKTRLLSATVSDARGVYSAKHDTDCLSRTQLLGSECTDEISLDDGMELTFQLATLQVSLNARSLNNDRSTQRSDPTGDGPIFTSKGHRDIDAYIRMYLESNQCSGRKTKRLDSIWGIAPPTDRSKAIVTPSFESELDVSCTFA